MLAVVALAVSLSFVPSSAPAPEAPDAAVAARARSRVCGTTALRDVPAGAGFDIGFGNRPDGAVDSADSALHPMRVHRGSGATPAQAALVLAELDAAWALQVDGAGFPAPLSDFRGFGDVGDGGDAKLDVYLAALPDGVFATTVSGGTSSTRPVFIQIDPQQPDDLLAAAAHHEFQHAVQFAVDARESAMWFESNATAWEVKGRPDVDAWLDLIADFQQQPQAPLFTDSFSFAPFASRPQDTFEYGAALFVLYLDEVHGDGDGTFLRELWQASAQPGTENEPDWLDALAARDDLFGGDPQTDVDARGVDDVIADFASWRGLLGSFDVDDDGLDVATDGRATIGGRTVLLASLAGVERETTLPEGPFVGGCSVHVGAAPAGEAVPVRIEATSIDGHDLAIAVAVVDVAADDGAGTSLRARTTSSPTVSHDVTVPAGQTLIASICDVSAADADDEPTFAPVRLRLSRTDVDAGEGEGEGEGEVVAEGEGEGEGPVDCGCCCQQTGDPRGMRQTIGLMGFFVGAFALLLRGYRAWRRRQLYRSRPAAPSAASSAPTHDARR